MESCAAAATRAGTAAAEGASAEVCTAAGAQPASAKKAAAAYQCRMSMERVREGDPTSFAAARCAAIRCTASAGNGRYDLGDLRPTSVSRSVDVDAPGKRAQGTCRP